MSSEDIKFIPIPYQPDSCALFNQYRDLPYAALLDSCVEGNSTGRYDIITANPATDAPRFNADDNLNNWLDTLQAYYREQVRTDSGASQALPFCGGLLGYIDYDAGQSLVDLPDTAPSAPRWAVNAYRWAIVQDHLKKQTILAMLPGLTRQEERDLLLRAQSRAAPTASTYDDFELLAPFRSNMSPEDYQQAFEQVQRYINAGDCYQINLAQRFSSHYKGDSWQAYQRLRKVARAPFSAYLQQHDGALLCLSPERFIRCDDQQVETSPIKGTRPRHRQPEKDAELARALSQSSKDRAENLMIVDLLRNDLGRSCEAGSIDVSKLFEVQSFATVHHLVSTITGTLKPEFNAIDLLRHSFPGGSITGAPKRRAMQIIQELEPHPREAFCGSLFYLSATGQMDSNILIRSLLCRQGEIHCWAGGGVVADSRCEAEYQECLDKISPLLGALSSNWI